MRQRTVQNPHQLHSYKSMIIHMFYQTSSLHFPSLHFPALPFTTLQFPFFTSIHFCPFRHHASETLHFSPLVISFPSLFLTICDLYEKVTSTSAGSWFHSLIILLAKEYLPIPVLCFLALILRSWDRSQFDYPTDKGIFTDICSLYLGPNFTIVRSFTVWLSYWQRNIYRYLFFVSWP